MGYFYLGDIILRQGGFIYPRLAPNPLCSRGWPLTPDPAQNSWVLLLRHVPPRPTQSPVFPGSDASPWPPFNLSSLVKNSISKFNRWKLLFFKNNRYQGRGFDVIHSSASQWDKSPLRELWRSWCSATGMLTGNPPVGAFLAPSALCAHVRTRESSSVIPIPDSHSLNITTRHKTPVSLPDLNKNQQCYSLGDVISMYDFTGRKLRCFLFKDFRCILKAPWLVQKKYMATFSN